ncbi:MAG: HesA/MoeB/ThiF family protein [Spirochaetia bacterium]|nr:HesA/MoeB/ThiF family protein [Spirochaetia bacterium]
MLSRDDITRYSRNILLPEVRRAGQERLQASSVLVIGAGGIGSPVLLYLAAAGVGRIRCVDNDSLDLTNLQRQVLYSTTDVGKFKIQSAETRIKELNPGIETDFRRMRFDEKTSAELIDGVDLVIETSDNFETKFLANDSAVRHKVPLIAGGILRFDGQVFCISPGVSACYRCLFHAPPPEGSVPNCAAAGVIGAVAGVIGSIMSGEAVKILLGQTRAFGLLQQYSLLESEWRTIQIPRNPGCTVCA